MTTVSLDVVVRPLRDDDELPDSWSMWDDWGDKDPRAMALEMRRFVVEVTEPGAPPVIVGDMTAHLVWYGATTGSGAWNIGASLVEHWRGRGVGSRAQRLLADLLHEEGAVRVEASTDVDNIAERRSLEKAGFAFEGIARGAQVRADGRHDLAVFASIREEADRG
jgi:RimJ/RimL family protein N-acetyltransferase